MKFNRFALLASVCFLAIAAMSKSFAFGEDSNEALADAQAWVTQIDAGKYDESYEAGCLDLRNKVTEEKWTLVLRTFRSRWGAVVHRELADHTYKPDGIEGLTGECMVVDYNTSFKNLAQAREEIVLKWEDGRWRGAGYNCGPAPSDAGDDQAPALPAAQTEGETIKTNKPPQQ